MRTRCDEVLALEAWEDEATGPAEAQCVARISLVAVARRFEVGWRWRCDGDGYALCCLESFGSACNPSLSMLRRQMSHKNRAASQSRCQLPASSFPRPTCLQRPEISLSAAQKAFTDPAKTHACASTRKHFCDAAIVRDCRSGLILVFRHLKRSLSLHKLAHKLFKRRDGGMACQRSVFDIAV